MNDTAVTIFFKHSAKSDIHPGSRQKTSCFLRPPVFLTEKLSEENAFSVPDEIIRNIYSAETLDQPKVFFNIC